MQVARQEQWIPGTSPWHDMGGAGDAFFVAISRIGESRPLLTPHAQRIRGVPGMLEMVIGQSRLPDQGGWSVVGERFGKAFLLKGLKTPSVMLRKGLQTHSGGD